MKKNTFLAILHTPSTEAASVYLFLINQELLVEPPLPYEVIDGGRTRMCWVHTAAENKHYIQAGYFSIE